MATGGVQVQQMEETVTYESNTSLEELMLHNNCPIHMLLKCIPQFHEIVQLYFRCKICQQAQVHAGINTFLQHVKEVHGEFFQPQYEVIADSNNVTMVVVPPETKAEVVETIVTETEDGYHDNENYTDTYETSFSDQIIETQDVKDSNNSSQEGSETQPPQTSYPVTVTEENEEEVTSVVTTTSALEHQLTAPSHHQTIDTQGVVVSESEIIQEEELSGATVIEMTPAEAEQVLIQAGTQVIENDGLMQHGDGGVGGGGGVVIQAEEEVQIEGATVEALIGNQATIETQVIGNQATIETQVIGHQAIEAQIIGDQTVEIQVMTPGMSSSNSNTGIKNEYQAASILTPLPPTSESSSAAAAAALEIIQGIQTSKTEVYQEEIQVTELQMLQEQAQQMDGGEDPNSLKYRKCKKCLKTFVNNHSLQRHYKETHLASPNWFVCPIPGCKYMAKRRSDIVGSHLRRRHKNVDVAKWKQDPGKVKKVHLPLSAEKLAENQLLIEQCMFKKKKARVPRMAPDGNIYTCKECDLYFSNMKMLKRHHQTKHADEILWMLCPVDGCNFTCKTKRHLLEIHIPRRHRDENLDYYKDNKEIIQKVYLPRGMKYLPEYEEQLYTDSTEYLEEAETIAKKKELANNFPLSDVCDQTVDGYSCKICRKTYKEKKRIRQHYRIFHSDPTTRPRSRRGHLPLESMAVLSDDKIPEDMASLICKECNREYKSKHSLRRHYIDNHLDEIVWYMCPVEGCKYASKRHADLLHSHCERIHKGVDVGQFKKKPGLLQTLSMPPGEHPVNTDGVLTKKKKSYAIEEIADVYAIGEIASFKCKECAKDFNSRQSLRQHFGDNHAELVTWYKCPVVGCFARCKRRHELIFLHFPKSHKEMDVTQWKENSNLIEFVQLPPEVDSSRADSIPTKRQKSFPIEAVADMSVSNEDVGYKCKECEQVFELKKELREHYRMLHLGTEIWFRCPVQSCGYMSSKQQEMLESHIALTHQHQDMSMWTNDPSLLERVQVQLESEDESGEDESAEEEEKPDTALPAKRKRGSLPLDVIAEKQSVEESPTTGLYKCASCEKYYTSVISLRRHYEANHADKITWYKCPVQGCRYATKRPLDLFASHCPRVHKDEDVSIWKNHRSLLEVMILPPGEEPVSEKGEPISKKREVILLDDKADTSDSEGIFKCKYCGEEYDQLRFLRQHYDTKHQDEGVRWYKCPIKGCDVIRRKASEITGLHFTKVHDGMVDVSLWRDNPDLLESVRLPMGISRMGEQIINGSQKRDAPQVKKDTLDSEEEESYPCHLCGKDFQTPAMLRRHESSHSLPATNIRWYKCPVGECKFITNTVSGILKTHWGRAHSEVDVSRWKEDPSLIDTVEMASGIGGSIKKEPPKSKLGRPPKNKRRKLTAEENDEKECEVGEVMKDQMETPNETTISVDSSASLRRSGRSLDKTAARLQSFLKNQRQSAPLTDNKEDPSVTIKQVGRKGRPPKVNIKTPSEQACDATTRSLAFRCNKCDHNYGDIPSLKRHYDLVHTERLWFKCPVPGCKVVASSWGDIVDVHWILEHKDRDVAKYRKNPRALVKVPENSIVFSAQEEEAIEEESEDLVKSEPVEVYDVKLEDSN